MIKRANINDWEYISMISKISGYYDYINQIGMLYMFTGEVYISYDDTINGFLKIEYLNDSSLWVTGLRVHPDYRRKNIASNLMDYVINRGKSMKYGYVRALVESINYKSVNLMEKLNLNKKLKVYFFNGGIDLNKYNKSYCKHFVNDDWRFYYSSGFFYKNDDNTVYLSNNRHKCYTVISGNNLEYINEGITVSYENNINLPPMEDFKSGYIFEKALNL